MNKTLDDYLNAVDYKYLNSNKYVPSKFALTYMNFIKLVNKDNEEEHKTPPMHLKMLDRLGSEDKYIANLAFRGSGKALALDTLILTPDGHIPMSAITVGSEVYDRNGEVCKVTYESEVFDKPSYRIILSDGSSFVACEDHIHIVNSRTIRVIDGKKKNVWKEQELTTKELLSKGYYYIREKTYRNPTGRDYKFFIPHISREIDFPNKPVMLDPYTVGVLLGDGSITPPVGQPSITCHADDLEELLSKIPYEVGNIHTDKRRHTTKSFTIKGINDAILNRVGLCNSLNKAIPQELLYNSVEVRLKTLQGLMDTDGTISKDGYTSFCSVSKSLAEGVRFLVKSLGGDARITRHENKHSGYWFVSLNSPNYCPFSMKRKVKYWVEGKTNNAYKQTKIINIEQIENVPTKCIAVSSPTKSYVIEDCVVTHNTTINLEYLVLYLAVFGHLPHLGALNGMIYVGDSIENGVKDARKNIEFRYDHSEFLQSWLPEARFTERQIEFRNKENKPFMVKMYGASTGIRGSKIYGGRPKLAVLDDLISDKIEKSKATMDTIKDTVYKGINHALHPSKRKIIFNGTPFNSEDIIIEAVESGGWSVNVWPVCEKFPVHKEEFSGAWPDRFSYEVVKEQYEFAEANAKMSSFNQELMLRITSEESRLVKDDNIRWYEPLNINNNGVAYNTYITTDFAVSSNDTADDSVISVWAYTNNGDWLWLDGICEKQTIDKTMNDLFRLVSQYKPLEVGIETNGQQGAFLTLIQNEMQNKNIWFNFASNRSKPGIFRTKDKFTNFLSVLPWFVQGKMYFPKGMKDNKALGTMLQELRLVTKEGIKGTDNCIDSLSMLGFMNAWKPSGGSISSFSDSSTNDLWDNRIEPEMNPLESYLV